LGGLVGFRALRAITAPPSFSSPLPSSLLITQRAPPRVVSGEWYWSSFVVFAPRPSYFHPLFTSLRLPFVGFASPARALIEFNYKDGLILVYPPSLLFDRRSPSCPPGPFAPSPRLFVSFFSFSLFFLSFFSSENYISFPRLLWRCDVPLPSLICAPYLSLFIIIP